MKRVIVVVRGGLVDAVYSDGEKISVDVLDYDNFEDDSCSMDEFEAYKKLQIEVDEKLDQVY